MTDREKLIQAGRLIFGTQWQTPMSKLMNMSDRTIRRIVAGTARAPSTDRIVEALNEQLNRTKTAIYNVENNIMKTNNPELDVLVNAVNNAESLTDLCNSLNELADYIRNSDDDYIQKIEDIIKIDDLKTFGNNEPTDTDEIFSWDDENYLMYDNNWYTVSRSDDE
ncbi:TPA: hypothetical protein ACWMH2_000195 [Proteus mirabilis]|nr:hypothetical protein [Proteus mirabilis]MBI6533202.1 hypothetical protein [Proteus mirabilis]HCU0229318.1 hypothetical protein [Proteus mirabilis]HEK1164301.1 hypothetical protein [Proteus mirabilis]